MVLINTRGNTDVLDVRQQLDIPSTLPPPALLVEKPTVFSVAPRVQLSLCTDDTLLTATSANLRMVTVYVQRQLDLLESWLLKWRIKVNADKCMAITF
ncbi:hypothetical protein J6590_084397 [Homalodisca vitripennis]|nr:hypothetical protein J6590_084397 [Homalodisca vitripennis]